MEIALALAVVMGAAYLFISERFPPSLVAMMALTVCLLLALLFPWLPGLRPSHWITLEEGVSGFSNPATLTVAAMFVLSAGLQNTAALAWLGPGLSRLAHHRILLLLVLMTVACAVSAFVNNTAAVAIFLPVVLAACARNETPPSRYLMPLSFATQFGGVCTLVGTSTNLLVSSISERAGHGSFRLFEFFPLGAVLSLAGIAYILATSRWLLPDRPGLTGVQGYQVAGYITEFTVPPDSPLIGQTVAGSGFGQHRKVQLLAILRAGQTVWPEASSRIEAQDVLLVEAPGAELIPLRAKWKIRNEPDFQFDETTLPGRTVRLAEIVISPASKLVGQTLEELDFRRRHGCLVLGLRSGQPLPFERMASVRLGPGDALLVIGPDEDIGRLRCDTGFLMLDRVDEPALRRTKVPLALGIFGGVIALAATGAVPLLPAALSGCVILVATGCLSVEEAYQAINWKVIFLLAGVLPLGLVLEKSGAATLMAQGAIALAKPWGPVAALAMLYLATAVLTEFMSNGATAVLLAPVAISVAASLGVDERPFLMGVCFAASTSFCTPVGYQTNAMVQHEGGYRFSDYLRLGLPLNLLFCGICVWLIPRFWSF